MVRNNDCIVYGLKFWDLNRRVLLACGFIDEPGYREDLVKENAVSIKEFNLNQGERIIGFRSSGAGLQMAFHHDLMFIIGFDHSKTLLLKLLKNRNTLSSNRVLLKVPEGVFREIIKYTRY